MKFLVLLMLSIFVIGCDKIDEDVDLHIIPKYEEIDVYSDTYLYNLFDTKDIELLTENVLIDTSSIGSKYYTIKYKFGRKKYEYKLEYTVLDREPPRYFGGTNKTVLKNYDEDLCNLIMYGDNYDGNLSCIIEGKYNLEKVGKYNLIYKVSDSSNNTTDIKVTLNVIAENKSTSTSNTKKTMFKDILEEYKNENTEVGIDVSKWQGDIDFTKIKNAGASFVMIRIGVQTKAKGELTIDPYFKQNIKNAKKAGLKVGIYLYSIATSSDEAKEHANWVIKTLDGEKLDLPIVFDWENWSKWNSYKISLYEINNVANVFMKTIEDNGYKAMLYGSKYYLENIWTNKFNYSVWLAHYTSKTSYKNNYVMWQLSNTGKIDGIYGDVDINVLYTNKK